MALPDNPSTRLVGLDLDGGWHVVERSLKPSGATGGNFSQGYVVRADDGRQGFLKALDYSFAHGHPDTAGMLQKMTAAYNFEKRLCDKCRTLSMTRVVCALAAGAGHVLILPRHKPAAMAEQRERAG